MEENNNEQSRDVVIKDKTDSIIDKLIQEEDVDKAKDIINLFNLNIAKKNAIRVSQLNNLLDSINDQAIKRFDKRPDEVSNKDLLAYMSAVQAQLEKSQLSVKSISEMPAIQIQNNLNINIEENKKELPKESRDRVLSVIQAIIAEAEKENRDNEVIDVEVVDKNEQGS